MICTAVQEALSVRADGELQLDPVLTEHEVDHHLETCNDCIAFEASSRQIRQALRIEMVAGMPDFASSVLDELPQTRGRRRRLGQAALVAASVGAVAAMSAVLPTQSGDLVAGNDAPVTSVMATVVATTDYSFPGVESPDVDLSPKVVWSPTAFDDETASRVAANHVFQGASVVGLSEVNATVGTETASLEVLSFDPETYPDFVGELEQASFAGLATDQVVVSASAAETHGLAAGGTMSLADGVEVEVAAVVPDASIADAEIALVNEALRSVGTDRFTFVLVDSRSDAQTIEAALEDEIGDRPFVARPFSPDAAARPVPKDLPDQPEFAIAESSGVEPATPGPQIKRSNIPLLGEVLCHKKTRRALTGAMERLERNGLAELIDPETIVTCFEPLPTLMTMTHGNDHTTGLGVDIYVDDDGVIRPVDRRVRKLLEKFGFVWDPEHAIHFEYVG